MIATILAVLCLVLLTLLFNECKVTARLEKELENAQRRNEAMKRRMATNEVVLESLGGTKI